MHWVTCNLIGNLPLVYGGISLAAAREKLLEARQLLRDGISPALQKQSEKARGPEIKTFGAIDLFGGHAGDRHLAAGPSATSA